MATAKKKSGTKTKAKKAKSPRNTIQKQLQATRQAAARALGMGVQEYAKADTDTQLRGARLVFAKAVGLEDGFDILSDEDFEGLVTVYFAFLVFMGARSPLNLRAEMRRYIAVLKKIQKSFPKGKRTPGADVQKALELMSKGASLWQTYPEAITKEEYGKDYAEMDKKEKSKNRRILRRKITALERTRRVREDEKQFQKGKHS